MQATPSSPTLSALPPNLSALPAGQRLDYVDQLVQQADHNLVHVDALLGLARDIACDLHEGESEPDLMVAGGRLMTVLYCMARELRDAQEALAAASA